MASKQRAERACKGIQTASGRGKSSNSNAGAQMRVDGHTLITLLDVLRSHDDRSVCSERGRRTSVAERRALEQLGRV
jgi:hypothetical protein